MQAHVSECQWLIPKVYLSIYVYISMYPCIFGYVSRSMYLSIYLSMSTYLCLCIYVYVKSPNKCVTFEYFFFLFLPESDERPSGQVTPLLGCQHGATGAHRSILRSLTPPPNTFITSPLDSFDSDNPQVTPTCGQLQMR